MHCIIDLELPEINGFQLIHLLQEQMPDCKILIYTMHEEPWVIAKLAEEEISGAVSKNASTSELKQAINQIRLGHKYFSEVFSILHKKQINIDLHKIPELSKREKEVLTYLSEGLSTSEISDLLCLSTNTIQTYRKRLMEKLEAKNVAELVYTRKRNILTASFTPFTYHKILFADSCLQDFVKGAKGKMPNKLYF